MPTEKEMNQIIRSIEDAFDAMIEAFEEDDEENLKACYRDLYWAVRDAGITLDIDPEEYV